MFKFKMAKRVQILTHMSLFLGGVIQRIPLWQRMFTLLVQTTWNWMGFGGLSDMLYIFWFHLGRKWMKRSLELCKAATCHVASGVQAGIDQKNLKGSKGQKLFDMSRPVSTNQFKPIHTSYLCKYLGISWNQNVSPPSDYKIDIQELWWRSSPNFWAKMGSWLPPNPQIH